MWIIFEIGRLKDLSRHPRRGGGTHLPRRGGVSGT